MVVAAMSMGSGDYILLPIILIVICVVATNWPASARRSQTRAATDGAASELVQRSDFGVLPLGPTHENKLLPHSARPTTRCSR